MSRRRCNPPCECASAVDWLRANKHDLAGLTGQDHSALLAIAHCWSLYARGDAAGQSAALVAVRALLGGLQPRFIGLARELIAWAMDWGDRERLWPRVIAPGVDTGP